MRLKHLSCFLLGDGRHERGRVAAWRLYPGWLSEAELGHDRVSEGMRIVVYVPLWLV